MNRIQLPILATALAVVLSACTPAPTTAPEAAATSAPSASTTPRDAFFNHLTALCGQAFAGEVEVDRPGSTGPNPFADQALVMHVRECSQQEIRIPFHVGEDRSRTWVVTRIDDGLRLKHVHRLPDGSDDPVTMYGGDTAAEGTANRQEFPVDAVSQEMFTREGMQVSNTNTWAIEIEPDVHYTYELGRTDTDRLFRVRFDLGKPIDAPPAPWGAAD
jgi:hypothetical protein